MRVRYGKPIKAKSILGKCNIPSTYAAANITFYPSTTGTFKYYAGPSVLNIKYVNRQANHKYFLFLNAEIVYSWAYFGIWDTYNTGYEGNRTAPIKDGNNYYALISPTTSATNGVPSFQFGGTQNLPTIANYALIIDLTEIGLDNLTAQEFYNKYHQYFPLIATGEEITIDDKAGQVSLYSGLPSDYQRVEYIYQEKQHDSGTTNLAFIQSNLSFADLDAVEFDIAVSTEGGLHNNIVLCAYNTSFYIIVDKTTHKANGFSSSIWSSNSTSLFDDELRHKIKVSGLVSSDTTKIRTAWDWSWWHKTKWYGLKLYKNNIIIQNLIPCYRKSDNVIGMYDLVGNQFYTNQGTGTFLKGRNVSNTISCKVAGGSSDIYYGYNQILNRSTFISNGITWTLNSDSTFTLSGTTTSTYSSFGLNGILKKNHKYLNIFQILENPNNISMGSGFFNMGQKNPKISLGFSGAISLYPYDSSYDSIGIDQYGGVGVDLTGIKIRFQIIDLTWWYGENKEPSTYNEFKEKFIKEYYGFCPTPIKLTRYQIEVLPNYGYNQLSPLWTTDTYNGVTATIKNDGKDIELSGTATGWYIKDKNLGQTIPSGHKVLVMSEMINPTGANFGYRLRYNSNNPIYSNKEFNKIHTLTDNVNKFQLYADLGDNCTGIKLNNLVIIDLTDWYGEGNEPTTVEEFKQTFPNKYYAYSKKRLLNKYMINKLEN